ncbi:transcriptional regulator [Hahella sp. CCB-MM4]|uniref:ArsR/SmtB family transcription factor n=1 Tax=Hahella sp. (strain CCB-MM4) TaxID=1926491 RepID=UPI000B9BA815|nr:winged helix-turn-helix domain-containing protein [Hahella sp. CCB-MM4]OZG71641.1 transcriptional regulator [Hahella sp. CCB-MM4]
MNTNEIARIAALVGEPARTAMLLALMDGRAFTAHELAEAGGITPQTASRHLSQLVDAGLLSVEKQGRHRYHRLASEKVAIMLEGIMQVASIQRTAVAPIATGPKDQTMRRARMCYDHIAGRLGVAIAEHLISREAIILDSGSGQITEQLNQALAPIKLQLDLPSPNKTKALCRPCLDWSERRYHVAGHLGRQICDHLIEHGYLRRKQGERALTITTKGATELRQWLGQECWERAQL